MRTGVALLSFLVLASCGMGNLSTGVGQQVFPREVRDLCTDHVFDVIAGLGVDRNQLRGVQYRTDFSNQEFGGDDNRVVQGYFASVFIEQCPDERLRAQLDRRCAVRRVWARGDCAQALLPEGF